MSVWRMMIVVAGSATLLAACGGNSNSADNGGGSGCTTPKGAGSGTAAQTVKVISDPNTTGAYAPATVSVKKGESVQWDWADTGAQHSVTSDDNTTFDSCLQGAGSKFLVTFNTTGEVKYHCTIHSAMVGVVKVN